VLGQRQGVIRTDEDPNFMALILLGILGQAVLSVLAGRDFTDNEIKRLIRIVLEGIGTRSPR
jgi:TetR/AcrR family transcriptional regulator of autoinduction and epiphytic fitness